jgi:hypothetical protein
MKVRQVERGNGTLVGGFINIIEHYLLVSFLLLYSEVICLLLAYCLLLFVFILLYFSQFLILIIYALKQTYWAS